MSIFFPQKSRRKEGKETSSETLFAFQKALHEVKLGHTIKTGCWKIQSVDKEI